MTPEELPDVPRPRVPVVLTVDAGSTGARSPRFLTLVVSARREERCRTGEPAHHTVDLPAAS
jgi:hypothetical protein